MTWKDLKVGDKIWEKWDIKSFHQIIGETSRSWIVRSDYEVKRYGTHIENWHKDTKLQKSNQPKDWFLTEKESLDLLWARKNCYRIGKLVQTLEPERLRKVAEIIGYVEEEKP